MTECLHADGVKEDLDHLKVAIRPNVRSFFGAFCHECRRIAELDLELMGRWLAIAVRCLDLGQVNLEKLMLVADAILEPRARGLSCRWRRHRCFGIHRDAVVKVLLWREDVHVSDPPFGDHALWRRLDDLQPRIVFVRMHFGNADFDISVVSAIGTRR